MLDNLSDCLICAPEKFQVHVFNRIQTHHLCDASAVLLPTELWSHSDVSRSICERNTWTQQIDLQVWGSFLQFISQPHFTNISFTQVLMSFQKSNYVQTYVWIDRSPKMHYVIMMQLNLKYISLNLFRNKFAKNYDICLPFSMSSFKLYSKINFSYTVLAILHWPQALIFLIKQTTQGKRIPLNYFFSKIGKILYTYRP